MNNRKQVALPTSQEMAHEIWAAAQTPPGECIEAAVARVSALLPKLHAEGVPAATPAEPTCLRPPMRRISGVSEGVLGRAAMRHRAARELQDASALAALADGLESIAGNENAELAAIYIRRQAKRMASAWEANWADFNAWHKRHFGEFVPVLPLHDARLIGWQAGTANERSPLGNPVPPKSQPQTRTEALHG